MATNFRDDAGVVRLDGTLYAPGATVGDVLTVQADGSLAPAAGGGSQPGAVRVLKFPFDFTQAADLAVGVPVWTPAADDVLLDAWVEMVSSWPDDGSTTPFMDIGVIVDGTFPDLFGQGFWNHDGNVVNLSDDPWTVGTTIASPLTDPATSLFTRVVAGAMPSAGTTVQDPRIRFLSTTPLSLVVSGDGTPAGDPYDGSGGSSTLYLVVSSPGDAS